jgi:hypothetical protein
MADGGDSWRYINLDLDIEPVVPNWLEMPTAMDVNLEKTLILALTATKKETLKLLIAMYKEELANTKQILDMIQAVRTHIVTTVSARNIVYINNKNTVYQMLVALKKRLAPTNYARKLELA